MTYNLRVPALIPMLLVMSTLSASKAATIGGTNSFLLPGFSTGSLTAGLPVSPNNDNTAAASPNLISVSIFFNNGGIGPADLEFALTSSGGTTEYRVAPAGFGLVNNTGSPFTGFIAELGFGTGASFVRSGAGDDLDFDTPDRDPAPTLPAFSTLTHDSDRLVWSAGAIPSVGGFSIGMSLDVPDGLSAVHPDGLNRFTLRLTPVAESAVPEPATSLLMVIGLSAAGLAVGMRRPHQ